MSLIKGFLPQEIPSKSKLEEFKREPLLNQWRFIVQNSLWSQWLDTQKVQSQEIDLPEETDAESEAQYSMLLAELHGKGFLVQTWMQGNKVIISLS